MTTGVDTEKFIEDIYNKPIIWNRNCATNKALTETTWIELSKKYLTSIPVLKAKWKGLRDMFRVEIKRIPRSEAGENLVDPHEYDSKWTHYQALLFLADHMRSRNVKCAIIDPIQKMEVLDSYSYMANGFSLIANSDVTAEKHTNHAIKMEAQLRRNKSGSESPSSPLPPPNEPSISFASSDQQNEAKRRKLSTTNGLDVSANSSENGDRIINDDYHFLLSLQPFMSELSPVKKLRLRMKIQKLVFEELYGNQNVL